MLKEGTAVAKYNFNPQTGSELALKRVSGTISCRVVKPNVFFNS